MTRPYDVVGRCMDTIVLLRKVEFTCGWRDDEDLFDVSVLLSHMDEPAVRTFSGPYVRRWTIDHRGFVRELERWINELDAGGRE